MLENALLAWDGVWVLYLHSLCLCVGCQLMIFVVLYSCVSLRSHSDYNAMLCRIRMKILMKHCLILHSVFILLPFLST